MHALPNLMVGQRVCLQLITRNASSGAAFGEFGMSKFTMDQFRCSQHAAGIRRGLESTREVGMKCEDELHHHAPDCTVRREQSNELNSHSLSRSIEKCHDENKTTTGIVVL